MKTVSREELYELVWSKPMTKVAADFGVTGTALKKTCDRHDIPTPERGYWAKLEHGKQVNKETLPPLTEPNLGMVRIWGSPGQRLAPTVREARERAKEKLHKHAPAKPELMDASEQPRTVAEPPFLAATRRAISRARPDNQGFAAAQAKGVVPLKIAPASIERGIRVLSQLFALAETQSHLPKVTEDGLVLIVENEAIAFGIEEQPLKTLHEPTASELKRRDERMRWGYSSDPWPKYDQAPSGRLAIVIHANSYSGLRRTYSDGKTQTLEGMLPDILAGFVAHAAHVQERKREAEERERQYREAEARRQREQAFNSREKGRLEFVDAIHEQLSLRDKLTAVLQHLEKMAAEDTPTVTAMATWIRQSLNQIDALIGPQFLDLSVRSAKVDFTEPVPGDEAERNGFYYSPPSKLQLWSVDEVRDLATSCSAYEWRNSSAPPTVGDNVGSATPAERPDT